MIRRIVLLIAVCLLLAPSTSWALDYGVGIRAGTQGLGAEGAIGVNKWVTVRVGLHGATVSESFEESGIDYEGDLTLGGWGALVDFFPMRGKFRVTAGLFANSNEIEIKARPTTDIEIGNNTYTPAQVGDLTGVVDFDSTAPYFGIGWGNVARGNRVGFLFDLGMLSQGSGDISLTASGAGVNLADLQAEIQQLEDDIGLDFWPVISAGVSIRF